MDIDSTWVLMNRLTAAMGIPVYTQKSWSYNPAAAWQGTGPDGKPMLLINQKWAKYAALPLRGKYKRTTPVILGWEKLIHEYTHSLGYQHLDSQGNSAWGSDEFLGHQIDQVHGVIGKLKLPKPYKKWLTRSIIHELRNTHYIDQG